MRILDLFCGAGGAAMGYARAGFEVVGVDLVAQPHYPFEFHQWDALATLEFDQEFVREFDAIHASPPCQHYSTMSKRGTDIAARWPDLVGPVRELLVSIGLPWVIENVPGSPLANPVRLCGSAFGLGVQRHRLFESNIRLLGTPCRHQDQPLRYWIYDHGSWRWSRVVPVYGHGGGKADEHWNDAMGISWMNRHELAESIPPAYTEFIGKQLKEFIDA